MAKNTKKPPIHNGKPITAFFARSNKASPTRSSQDASRPTAKQPSTQPSSTPDSGNAENSVTLSNVSRVSKFPSKKDSASEVGVAMPKTPRHSDISSPLTFLMSPISTLSIKRSRSPDLPIPQLVLSTPGGGALNGSPRYATRNRSRFGSEADFDALNTTPNPKSKKRTRLVSEDPVISDLSDVVPSSQSDEELALSRHAAVTYNSAVLPSPPDDKHDGGSMEVDGLAIEGISPLTSPIRSPRTSQSSEQMLTPPPSSHISVPPTPVALDAASKTAKIIADIKAKAYAQATSSPEATPLEFNDISDSSSDEEYFLPTVPTTTIMSPKSSGSQATGSSMATRRSTRNATKIRSPSPTGGSRLRASSSRLTAVPSATAKRPQAKKAPADPFAALLKEKRTSQKNGNGSEAFLRAELIRSKSFSIDDLDDTSDSENDDDKQTGQNEEDRALEIAQNSALFESDEVLAKGTKSRKGAPSDGDDLRKTLFGGGKAIRNILEQDKALKKFDESSEKTPGIRLWISPPSTPRTEMMDVSSEYQPLPESSPVARLFNSLMQRGDFKRTALHLNANFIASLEVSDRPFAVSKLYDLAFLPHDVLAGAAVHALEEFWNSSTEPTGSAITFSQILATIQTLGTDTSIISAQEWPIINVVESVDIASPLKEFRIQSLLILIDACARSKRLQEGDIPDIILTLALIGLDSTTSPNLWRDITATVNLACQCIIDNANAAELEIRVCSKLLKCASTFEAVNKARLVYLLSTASGPARRIANVVAYCIITDKEAPDHELFSGTPPLPEVVEQLAPYSKASRIPPGKFSVYEGTDYVDLGFYTTILGVAVSNLREYVFQERQLSAQRNSSFSSPKIREKPKTDLQHLYVALETLHSNISDTRATHLERSRTKENIKGLAMNVHYQREHWIRNLPDSKTKTLSEYFGKKVKS